MGPAVGERTDTERENSPAVAGAVVVGDTGPLIYTGLLTTSTLQSWNKKQTGIRNQAPVMTLRPQSGVKGKTIPTSPPPCIPFRLLADLFLFAPGMEAQTFIPQPPASL